MKQSTYVHLPVLAPLLVVHRLHAVEVLLVLTLLLLDSEGKVTASTRVQFAVLHTPRWSFQDMFRISSHALNRPWDYNKLCGGVHSSAHYRGDYNKYPTSCYYPKRFTGK